MCRLILLIALYVVFAPAATRADESRWQAWLHYGQHMTMIDSMGNTLREVDLPVPNAESMPFQVTVSPDGRRIAYLTQLSYEQTFLSVYDTVEDRIILTHAITGEYWITNQFMGSLMFNESGEALAFGYGIYLRELLEIEWHILILRPATGEIIYAMDKTQPNMLEAMGTHARLTFLAPYIRQYVGQNITFTLELLETEGNPKSFVWNTATGEVAPDIAYPNMLGNRFTPTGEVVMPLGDSRFPGRNWGESGLRLPNTLHVYDPVIHGRYPFYVSADTLLTDALFVQSGERVLMQTTDETWHLLERDGSAIGSWTLPENMLPDEVTGTPDGFIYVTRIRLREDGNQPLIPAVFEVNTREASSLGMGRVVWSTNAREFQSKSGMPPHASIEIVWVNSDVPVGPFLPWAQLAAPVYQPTGNGPDATVSPTPLPPPEPIFQVGDEVKVQTLDGEILNLRGSPTRESDIIVYLEDDTRLLLLEGPVEAEGYNWWRVRTPDDLEGWVVENDGELQTLLPIRNDMG